MRYGMLSDDLTGSMDAGVRMLAAGLDVGVCFEPGRIGELAGRLDLVVLDTESRNVAAADAVEAVRSALESLRTAGAPLLYKKIDSTLRGNLGAELDTVLQAGSIRTIVVAPALPYNGRVTRGGVVFVHGVPLAETEFAADPLAPLTDSRAAALIARQSRASAALVDLETVRGGSLASALARMEKAGSRILVADAESDADLALIARALFGRAGVLGCGSAGLFDQLRPLVSDGAPARAAALPPAAAPAIVLSGSPSRVSKAQLARAAADGLVAAFSLDGRIADPRARGAEVERVAGLAAAALRAGTSVAVDGAGAGKAQILDAHRGDAAAMLAESARVQGALAAVLDRLLAAARPGCLVLFGGDTALSVCRRIGAAGLRIAAEAEPFVPAGLSMGGAWDGLPIVTKAGGFGSERVIERALSLLRG